MKDHWRQKMVWLFATVWFAVLPACENEKPITLGFVAGLTGRVADLGIAGRDGALLAIEQANAAGGIHGRPIRLVVRDDTQDPETARRVTEELIQQNVKVIIGPMTSSMAMAMVPVVNGSDCLLVSPTVTTTALSGKDDHFFRVASTTIDYAGKNARYQFEKVSKRTFSAIYDLNNSAYTESWLNDFQRTFESLGGRCVGKFPFQSSNDTVFFEFLHKAKRRGHRVGARRGPRYRQGSWRRYPCFQ